jgi:antitoxin component of RelBE/YafQ-DinJ toxin-antitoxin module
MPSSPKHKPVNISIDPEIWEQIKQIAKELNIPANKLVEMSFKETIQSQTF